MNVEGIHSSFHYSPQTYFKKALELFDAQEIPSALQSLDAAIVFSNSSPFYIYQKIRILYQLGAYKSCSELIVAQLEFLYKNSSLYIFCRVLDYLERIKAYSVRQIQTLLNNNQIPYCIANHYQEWLRTRKRNFAELAFTALRQERYSLCISYGRLEQKYGAPSQSLIYGMANAYHMLGKLEEASELYLSYYNLTEKKLEAAIQLACIHMELGHSDTAIQYLSDLLDQDPKNQMLLSYLAECYYLAAQYALSIKTYESIAKLYPDDLQNLFNLSHAYIRTNKKWHAGRCIKLIKKQLK